VRHPYERVRTAVVFRPTEQWKVLLISVVLALAGCATASPIQPAETSKSQFDGAVYDGETIDVGAPTPGEKQFRIFHQASTGFTPISAVRSSAEQRMTEFCGRDGKTPHVVRETSATPPYILGNWPRVELEFECLPKSQSASGSDQKSKYTKLTELKRLLDEGVLTQEEFEQEKKKVLSEP
jgi:hypothetical protein